MTSFASSSFNNRKQQQRIGLKSAKNTAPSANSNTIGHAANEQAEIEALMALKVPDSEPTVIVAEKSPVVDQQEVNLGLLRKDT